MHNELNLESFSYLNSMFSFKYFNLKFYYNFEENYSYFMYAHIVDMPYDNSLASIEKPSYKMFPGTYAMENNNPTGSGQPQKDPRLALENLLNPEPPKNDSLVDKSKGESSTTSKWTFIDPNQDFDYTKTYTFTIDELKKFQSLETQKLLREFDPAYLRKFSSTLRDEDFYKHLNSPTNIKFQDSLANSIKIRLNIVLNCYNNNYEEAHNDMNKTLNDSKGRVWYKDRPLGYKKVKNSHNPIQEWD